MGIRQKWNSKWARYEVRDLKQRFARSQLDLHANTQMHRRALQLLRARAEDPNFHFGRAAFTEAEEHVKDWQGRVPQVQSWVDAWAASTSSISFLKQDCVQAKKAGLAAEPEDLANRKQRRKLVTVMAEVVRQACREELRNAQNVSLALDGKGKRKVVRYCCDLPTEADPFSPNKAEPSLLPRPEFHSQRVEFLAS